MPFSHDFCMKRDNICQKITNFVSRNNTPDNWCTDTGWELAECAAQMADTEIRQA